MFFIYGDASYLSMNYMLSPNSVFVYKEYSMRNFKKFLMLQTIPIRKNTANQQQQSVFECNFDQEMIEFAYYTINNVLNWRVWKNSDTVSSVQNVENTFKKDALTWFNLWSDILSRNILQNKCALMYMHVTKPLQDELFNSCYFMWHSFVLLLLYSM